MPRAELWMQEDPAAEFEHEHEHAMHFAHVRASKSEDDRSRLRKLTSLSYLRGKLHGLFHRDGRRDTIVCEEDEASPAAKRNIYDIIRRSEIHHAHTSTGFDLRQFSSARTTTTTISSSSRRPLTQSQSLPVSCARYEPSREQRWCANCNKCFQRGLSRFDQYCGLDCRTAHRLRQSATQAPHYGYSGQTASLVSEHALAVQEAAKQPVQRYTTTYPVGGRMRVDRR